MMKNLKFKYKFLIVQSLSKELIKKSTNDLHKIIKKSNLFRNNINEKFLNKFYKNIKKL